MEVVNAWFLICHVLTRGRKQYKSSFHGSWSPCQTCLGTYGLLGTMLPTCELNGAVLPGAHVAQAVLHLGHGDRAFQYLRGAVRKKATGPSAYSAGIGQEEMVSNEKRGDLDWI